MATSLLTRIDDLEWELRRLEDELHDLRREARAAGVAETAPEPRLFGGPPAPGRTTIPTAPARPVPPVSRSALPTDPPPPDAPAGAAASGAPEHRRWRSARPFRPRRCGRPRCRRWRRHGSRHRAALRARCRAGLDRPRGAARHRSGRVGTSDRGGPRRPRPVRAPAAALAAVGAGIAARTRRWLRPPLSTTWYPTPWPFLSLR